MLWKNISQTNTQRQKIFKACSECAQAGHARKECSSTEKKCLNCEGDHRTLDAKCPKRKAILTQKKQGENSNMAYCQVTNQNVSTPSMPATSNEPHLKIFTFMLHAHFQNTAEPGTCETELNSLLAANKLPSIKIPKNPASSNIIGKMTETQQEENKETPDSESEEEEESSESESEETTTNLKVSSKKSKTSKMMKPKDINLHIDTSKSTG